MSKKLRLKVNGQKFKVGDKVVVAATGVVTKSTYSDVLFVKFPDGMSYEGGELEDLRAAIVKVG